MLPSDDQYRKILTGAIQKQIVILGSAITMTIARKVRGLTITDDGTVGAIKGNPQELEQELINGFKQISSHSASIIAGSLDINKTDLIQEKATMTAKAETAPNAFANAGAAADTANPVMPIPDQNILSLKENLNHEIMDNPSQPVHNSSGVK